MNWKVFLRKTAPRLLAAVLVIGGPMPYYGLARYLWYYPSAFLGMAAVISAARSA